MRLPTTKVTPPPTGQRQEPVQVNFCPAPTAPIAQYRLVVQSSDAVPGGVVNGRIYSVSAKLGDGTAPNTSAGTWKVTQGADSGELLEVNGPKIQVNSTTSSSSTGSSANQAQHSFARARAGPGPSWPR